MKEVKRTPLEFAVVAVFGLAIGLAANAMNPRGLSLTRNYFPNSSPSPPPPPDDAAMTEEQMVQHVKSRGLQPVHHTEMVEIFQSPYLGDGLYVIIDARGDDHYQAGHIPGAYQLDHYYLDRHIDAVMEACKIAERIVVYCNGGKCEDSELAAGDLVEKGVEPHKAFVYAGGFTMWQEQGMPVETGPRNSGQINRQPAKGAERATQEGAK